MTKVRGVRFPEAEDEQVEEFLTKNRLLDFSTLARIAIIEFIRKPELNLIAVSQPISKGQGSESNVRPS